MSRKPFVLGPLLVAAMTVLTACRSATAPGAHAVAGISAEPSPHESTAQSVSDPYRPPAVIDLGAVSELDAILPALSLKRIVYVGEKHDRYDHHLNQLEIIRRLHARNPDLAIGMEFFQQPFQHYLDAFIEGRIDEKEMLRRTEYYERWRFDYRLYRPILNFAREKRIPVLALNLPSEITRKVGRQGLDSLGEDEKAQIPQDIDRSNETYESWLRRVFEEHPGGERKFENFFTVQLLWDEGMAKRAADFLRDNPGRQLVVLAGSGHLEYGWGIPGRVARRVGDADQAIVLQHFQPPLDPDMADYLLVPEERWLPPAGKLGAFLNTGEEGVTVQSFGQGSAAQDAGIEEGDRILSVKGEPVKTYADLKVALWDKKPGDEVTVEVRRRRPLLSPTDLTLKVSLR